MAHVFISYARPDRALAADLAERLTQAGHDVWWDTNLVGGHNFNKAIDEQLRKSDVVIVIWTPSSARSVYVDAEAHAARSLNKLVPVMADSMNPETIPVPYNILHTLPLADTRQIIAALAGERPQPMSEYSARSDMSLKTVAIIVVALILLGGGFYAVSSVFQRF